MSLLSRIFNRNVMASSERINNRPQRRQTRRLFEALEPRVMLSAAPVITSAIATELGSTNNYSITINGSNLGSSTSPTGGGDITLVDPGVFTGGQTGDAVTLNVTSWTTTTTGASSITIGGLTGAYGQNSWVISPADSLVIAVMNPQTNISAVTNLTVPGTPEITGVSVDPIAGTNNWNLTISGHGLGTQAAYVGDSADITITDSGVGQAGNTGDAVTANVTAWNNNQVVINGLAGTYGQGGGWALNGGDSLAVSVSNPQDSLAAPTFDTVVTPVISSVSVEPLAGSSNNWTITINGSGFGTRAGYNNNDSPYLAIQDNTANFNAGFSDDPITANVTSWNNTQIVINGLAGAYGTNGAVINAQDSLTLAVANVQTGAVASAFSTMAGPTITSVSAEPLAGGSNNWTITINGSGFGTRAGYSNNDSPYLAIQDNTTHFNAGYSYDPITANVTTWTDSQIVISGLGGAYGAGGSVMNPGDALVVDVANVQTGLVAKPFNTVVGTGILSVSVVPLAGSSNNWTITINGSGFGTRLGYGNNDSPYLAIQDNTAHFNAGFSDDPVTANVTSWTNTQIIISGLAGAYGTSGWVISPGDSLAMAVANVQTGVVAQPFSVVAT